MKDDAVWHVVNDYFLMPNEQYFSYIMENDI